MPDFLRWMNGVQQKTKGLPGMNLNLYTGVGDMGKIKCCDSCHGDGLVRIFEESMTCAECFGKGVVAELEENEFE